jgi:DNA-binding PadR family transcriptional regulator
MTNAELAILGLIVEQPRHGYEIDQVIETRGMRDWTEVGFSSIYYLLKKLEREGLITGHLEEAERGPARKVFHATPAGVEARRVGVVEALSVPQRGHSPLLLGLANLPGIPADTALGALQQYCESLAERLAYVRERWANQQPLPYFVDAMFEHSVVLMEAELEWMRRLIRRMEEEHEQG